MDPLDENEVEPEEVKEENQVPVEMELEPPKKDLVAEGSKKLIQKLLKNPFVLGFSGLFLFLLFLIFLSAITESNETNNIPYKENVGCESVTVTYDPYNEEQASSSETMDLETYVKSAVYEYSKDIKEKVDMQNYYYALAVAVRTEVIANSCKITYRDKKLSKSVPSDKDIDNALELSEGVILTDLEENIVSSKVSDFCWNQKEEQEKMEYQIYQANHFPVPISFIESNLANEVYKSCQCNYKTSVEEGDCDAELCYEKWVIETDEETGEPILCGMAWRHQDDTTGYSVLGSYYIFRQYGRDHKGLLSYFFGNDTKYMTIKKGKVEDTTLANQTNCSEFSLTTTSLTKEQFIEKVNQFHSSESAWKLFQQNAGNIYDIAIANQANPEMIMVRANLEGFSPGGSTYNYFGIRCYNESPESCEHYKSFDDGILGFIKAIKKYESFEQMYSSYAYLGDYWYNPGSWGLGGCAYAHEIYPDGLDSYVQDACSEARKGNCTKSNKSMCVVTREEDRNAYYRYQGRKMTDMRERIFGISSDSCTNNTLNYGKCTIFNQSDPRWKSEQLGFGSSTMGNAGCAVTSVAIALTCTGEVTDSNFSPQLLNERLKAKNGFSGSLIYWDNEAIRDFVPNFNLGNTYSISAVDSMESKIEKLKTGLEPNRIGIVHLNSTSAGHFVVLQKINEDSHTISVLDPAGGKTNTYSLMNVDGFKYYTY